MFSERAGRYSLCLDDDMYDSYYTFIPHPLCRDEPIKIDDELIVLLTNAHRKLALLEGASRHIVDMKNITRLFMIKESAASYSIDDNLHFTRPELFGIIRDKKREQQLAPIQNHFKALEYGICELSRTHLTNRLICATHGILMNHKGNAQTIGAIRKKQTILGEYMVHVTNMKTYNPTEPNEINSCMADMQAYIKREDAIDLLIKAALLHYQMEAIHPFESGNGRVGRIMIAQYLHDTDLLRHTLLPISEVLFMDKIEYFDRLDAIHYRGNYEQWVKFFVRTLAVTAEATICYLEKALQLRKNNIARIHAQSKATKNLLEAYRYIEKHIFLDTKSLSEMIGISYNTAARIVSKLVELNILEQINNLSRNRIYAYTGLLEAVRINTL